MITGSVSWGTMRPQDLIPRFLDVIRVLDSATYQQIVFRPFPVIPGDAQENEDHPWWDSEEAHYLLEELFDTLDNLAPEGYYFGAHPGDGSDYGFWPIED